MIGYVWRVPELFAVMAASALLLFAAGVMSSLIVRRRCSVSGRVAAGSVVALVALGSAAAIRATAVRIARSFEVSVSYVDPGALGYVAPILFAAFALVVGSHLLNGAWTNRRALVLSGWLLLFTAANVINWCSPGWCGAFGFPFTWHSWSDSIITFDDGRVDRFWNALTTALHVAGGALNLLTFVVIATVLVRLRLRRRLNNADAIT